MKKILGITFGGLQKRAILLVALMLLLLAAMFAGITVYQNRLLLNVVSETRVEQQNAISETSKATMHQVIEGSLVSSTELQATLADNDFAEVISNTRMLQTMAEGILENRGSLSPLPVALPDAANDGTSSAFVLFEKGVDYRKSEYLGYLAHLSTPMIAMHRNSQKIDGCYIGLKDGTDLCVDDKAGIKLTESGEPIPFPVTERPWFLGALRSDDLYFTGITRDAFSGKLLITCSAPVHLNGEIVGVAGIDVVLSSVSDFIESSGQGAYSYLINDRGQVILGPEADGIFKVTLQSEAKDLRSSDNETLASFIEAALRGSTGLRTVSVDGTEYYMVGSPVPTVGWAVVNVVEKSLTEQPEQALLSAYDGINETASATFQKESAKTNLIGILLLAVAFLIGNGAAMLAVNRMVKPIRQMTEDITRCGQTGQPFEMQDRYRTNDEIEVLAESFADLSKKIRKYIQDITAITAEKERISTELALATRIQADMLPSIFPPYPDRTEFDIYASMDPAKEVGGDFYDFFLVDDDHLGIVIADVSGKGIPAALFMMGSKILVQNYAMTGMRPADVLEAVNHQICQNNREQMFVTVWLGILEISTGKLTCSNAGHEYPVLKTPDGDFELYRDKHGFIIGGMDGMRYKEYELTLLPGTKLFVYTDGVPEATDADGRLFGTERMVAALNEQQDASPEALLRNVRAHVDAFVGDAEQFDDLTMVCLHYLGPQDPTA
ncbi:MAG: SpoIIE family protein phosphatase [Clostridia bacterium]|nr:SpoIIE family protein phosphatase [Clostridia bacterium]MBQ6235492.1 SpoIIE family protein phosphatase [Clostridia bacterium]MBR0435772.1 SpoIIE family protein phosphatase [Clostridia bacterium]MBR0507888.1 SpoIIE family protein phosphatase [Clostridia bacterium]